MSYTRKNRETKHVSFSVNWIEEELNLPTLGSVPRRAVESLAQGIQGPLINELPADLGMLIEQCSQKEFEEFLEAWSNASRDREAEAKAMQESFQSIAALLGPKGKGFDK